MKDRLYYGDIYKRVNGEDHLVKKHVLLIKSNGYNDYLIYAKFRKNPMLLLKDISSYRNLNEGLNTFIPVFSLRDGYYFIDEESIKSYNERNYTLIKTVMKK